MLGDKVDGRWHNFELAEAVMNEQPNAPQIPDVVLSPVSAPSTQPSNKRPLSWWLKRLLACNPFYLVSAMLLLYFLLVLQASELLAVIVSAAIGRTPLKSNPNKSREGVAIGGGAAILIGASLWWMTPFSWWQSLLMAAAIAIAGFLGGLVLSAVKRSLGARDPVASDGVQLGRGMLDRLDALAFAAPVFFHLTLFFFAR